MRKKYIVITLLFLLLGGSVFSQTTTTKTNTDTDTVKKTTITRKTIITPNKKVVKVPLNKISVSKTAPSIDNSNGSGNKKEEENDQPK